MDHRASSYMRFTSCGFHPYNEALKDKNAQDELSCRCKLKFVKFSSKSHLPI